MIAGYQPSGVPADFRKRLIIDRLKAEGINTIGDLDKWRMAQTWKDQDLYHASAGLYHPSRHSALVRLVGSDAADEILNNLAILQCT